ncbi:MAG: SiaB family protein kinase [Bacteroidia bacterium]|nr:SiaB family protein kinase [Bacteroidia bacterium]
MIFVHDLHKKMLKNNLLLIYEGKFSQMIIDSVMRITDEKFDNVGETKKVKKLVNHVMVECLQNICIHGEKEDIDNNNSSSLLLIAMNGKDYIITTGNPINNSKIVSLKEMISKINNSTEEELKALFQIAITDTAFSEKGTAGLGLITIVRKTKNKLLYDFKRLSDDYSFFTLQTKIPRGLVTS